MRIRVHTMSLAMLINCSATVAVADEQPTETTIDQGGSAVQQDKPIPPKPRATGTTTTFTPTEQIKADSSVTFPVDI